MEKRLRTYFYIIASVLIYELISGIYIYLGVDFTPLESTVSQGQGFLTGFTESYQFNVLFHIFVGLIFFLPFTIYQYVHFRSAQAGWRGGYRRTS